MSGIGSSPLNSTDSHSLPLTALCWYADSALNPEYEVIINGVRRGIRATLRCLEKYRPRLCKLSLLRLHIEVLNLLGKHTDPITTYFEAKHSNKEYAAVQSTLKGPPGPFGGWVVSGRPWESFDSEGNVMTEADGKALSIIDTPNIQKLNMQDS